MTLTSVLAFIPNIGGWELLVVLVIGLLLFGRRLPEIGRSVGKTIVEFKKGIKDVQDDIDHEVREADRKRFDSAKKPADDEHRVPQGEPAQAAEAEKAQAAESRPATT